MTTARFYSTEGVVVRLNDLGEADRIVVLLTPGRGLVRGVARGARRPNSKLGGHLDLMRHVTVSAHVGRSLDSISQAETVNGFRGLREDLGRLSRGMYLCELAEKFSIEGAPAVGTFRMLADSLDWLQQARSPDLFLRWYEMRILHLNGFQPEVHVCADCGKELERAPQLFSAARGGLVCEECRPAGDDPLLPTSVGAIKLLRYLLRTDWETLDSLRAGDVDRRHVERILRAHLQHVLDRSVRSTAFLDEVSKWPEAGEVSAPR